MIEKLLVLVNVLSTPHNRPRVQDHLGCSHCNSKAQRIRVVFPCKNFFPAFPRKFTHFNESQEKLIKKLGKLKEVL